MLQLSILSLCVLALSAQDQTDNNITQGVIDIANNTNTADLVNTNNADPTNGTVKASLSNVTINDNEGNVQDTNQTGVNLDTKTDPTDTAITEAISDNTKSTNETFLEKVEHVMKRLFKRDIVGSLVRRNSEEFVDKNPKITVPSVFQEEYYLLKQRKEEIEENKNVWRHVPKANLSKHFDLIDNTWEKLVNWSQDHLAFEDKVIQINKLKQHDHVFRSSKDSDATEDSEDKLKSVDSDEDSDKSMRPEFATIKSLMEVNERYAVELKITELEKLMKDDPKEDNEKNKLLLKNYKHDLKLIDVKYDKIRAMKLRRELVEEVWAEKEMIKKMKAEKDSDES